MSIEIKAPSFPESVADGTIATWHKQVGEPCGRDELIADIETDKVVIEINAPSEGTLTEIIKAEGEIILSNELIARFEAGAVAEAPAPAVAEPVADQAQTNDELIISPAAKKMMAENTISESEVTGSGKAGRVTKEDVQAVIDQRASAAVAAPVASAPVASSAAPAIAMPVLAGGDRPERRVPMTRLRARIAERLLTATQTTAMLTTFNEVNMQPIMELRAKYKAQFEKTHNGTRLGFMSFFVRAATEALKRFPAVNASIDGDDIVYHGYFDVGVAVSSDRGLVVPVLRDADAMSLASVESKIREYGAKAMDGKLSMEEMTGGTFTITNGGVFGSLMSTPILNPPQAAILGMHKIQERPMAVNGEVKILPMMNLALSYDHRLIDGKDAVQFLVAIKDMIEDPARILLEL
ncbi:MAG: 2-oxoglutarate dehydrogenase complex dihydrolipoyllysine-residue succinyltransferase [Cellvibrionales bacterium]|nr:2-oxoglutarate dehydrogenase complex dihydrolipoyllysine-residue succinyltransferase [Cellvibrionales bacterium]